VTDRCKKKCGSICALPLLSCVVLSVHKSQGITVKKDNVFENLIVNLPTEQTRTSPGLELVASSRPDSIHNMDFGNNTSDLSHMMIIKIGTAASYAKRRLFSICIQQMAPQTHQITRDLIVQLCTLPTYEGGCMKLFNWFNELLTPGLVFSKQIYNSY
jgi:hypothetical protein